MARININAFMEYCFVDPKTKEPFKQCKLHREMQEHVTLNRKSLEVVPRDHGKSEQLAIGRAIWELGRNLDLRIKIVGQGDDPAVDRLAAIKAHITENERVREVFPWLKPGAKKFWSSTKIVVQRKTISKDASIEALGILSTATGGRGDIGIFDDPVDFRNAIQNPALRPMVKQAFYDVWMNILEEDARLWYIATPWHVDDLTHELMSNPAYVLYFRSIDNEYTPLWKEKWSSEKLKQREKEIGQRAYARGYKCIAISDEEATFPGDIIDRVKDETVSIKDIHSDWPTFGAVDLAVGKKETKEPSNTVIFTVATDPDNQRWVKEIVVGRYTSPKTAKIVNDQYRKHNWQVVFVENNAYQEALIQWIRELGYVDIPIVPYFTGKQKFDDYVGIPALAVEMQNGLWKLPLGYKHASNCECGFCQWIRELSEYPIGKTKDTVIGSWLAREAIRSVNRKYSDFNQKNLFKFESIPERYLIVCAISSGNPDKVKALWAALSPENKWYVFDYWEGSSRSVGIICNALRSKSLTYEVKAYLLDAFNFDLTEDGKPTLSRVYVQNGIPVRPANDEWRLNSELVREGLTTYNKSNPTIYVAEHLVEVIGELTSTFIDSRETKTDNPYKSSSSYLTCLEYILGLRLIYPEQRQQKRYVPANKRTGF